MKPKNKADMKRIFKAVIYSKQGLLHAYRFEAAFRQEVWIALVFVPLGLWIGTTALEKVFLSCSILLVLIVELLNSAIENTVDRIGSEYHELSGRAKDIGSAAVLLTIIQCGLVWVLILFG